MPDHKCRRYIRFGRLQICRSWQLRKGQGVDFKFVIRLRHWIRIFSDRGYTVFTLLQSFDVSIDLDCWYIFVLIYTDVKYIEINRTKRVGMGRIIKIGTEKLFLNYSTLYLPQKNGISLLWYWYGELEGIESRIGRKAKIAWRLTVDKTLCLYNTLILIVINRHANENGSFCSSAVLKTWARFYTWLVFIIRPVGYQGINLCLTVRCIFRLDNQRFIKTEVELGKYRSIADLKVG